MSNLPFKLNIRNKAGLVSTIRNANVEYDEFKPIIGQGLKFSIDVPDWMGQIDEITVSKGSDVVARITFI